MSFDDLAVNTDPIRLPAHRHFSTRVLVKPGQSGGDAHGLFIANRRIRTPQDETSDILNGVRTNAMCLILEEGQLKSLYWLCPLGIRFFCVA